MNTLSPSTKLWPNLAAELRPALMLFLVLSVITGLAYPLLITGIAQGLMPEKANGSVIFRDGKAVGSHLIGQSFSDERHLWGRPSATSPQPYNGLASSGSNLGPLNSALQDAIQARITALRAAHPTQHGPVPQDLVTASASGLDPELSPEAARWQVERIAHARGMQAAQVQAIIDAHTQAASMGLFGEARVNVLEVNLALDAQH